MRPYALLLVLAAVACKRQEQPAPAVDVGPPPPPPPGSSAWKVQNARSAAPRTISADAGVMDWPKDSTPAEQLAIGTNGWTCWPDRSDTPANDPFCLDEEMARWMQAQGHHARPAIQGMGVAYLLQGGSLVPDTVADGPHIVMVVPNPRQYAGLPTTRTAAGPWVKNAGTPWAHLIVPAR